VLRASRNKYGFCTQFFPQIIPDRLQRYGATNPVLAITSRVGGYLLSDILTAS
jgi:hypothetical protein